MAVSFADNGFCLGGDARPQPDLLPQEKEQLSHVSIVRKPFSQPRRGYFQRRRERENPLLGERKQVRASSKFPNKIIFPGARQKTFQPGLKNLCASAPLRLGVKNNCDKNQSVELLPQPDATRGK
jgi:hypothetical protein